MNGGVVDMDRSTGGEVKTKADWIIKALCFYNILAFFLSFRLAIVALHASLSKGMVVPWLGVLVMLGVLILFGISTIGLWFKKEWAYLVQVVLYLLQLLVLKVYALKFAVYLGFQYVITFTFTKTGGSIGLNLAALIFLVFLLAVKKEFLIRKS